MKRLNIEILYEDAEIVVVNKPPGLRSIPDRYNRELPSAIHILQDSGMTAFTVHRLDKETSGVMVFAKTSEAHTLLNEQFQHQTIKKEYLALVTGRTPEKGTIDARLTVHPTKSQIVVAKKGGKKSVTHYETLKLYRGYSLVSVRPESGRTHQIRVHLNHIGHEIIADPLYGKTTPLYLSHFKKKYSESKGKEERPLLNRLALHAEKIQLTHPATGKKIQFNAPLPKDFRAALRQLDKWAV